MNTPSFGKFSPRWLAGKRGLIVTLLAGLAILALGRGMNLPAREVYRERQIRQLEEDAQWVAERLEQRMNIPAPQREATWPLAAMRAALQTLARERHYQLLLVNGDGHLLAASHALPASVLAQVQAQFPREMQPPLFGSHYQTIQPFAPHQRMLSRALNGNAGLAGWNLVMLAPDGGLPSLLVAYRWPVTIGLGAVLASALLALPMAWYMARYTSGKMKAFFYIAVMLPMWASYIVKAYAWVLLLAKDGVAQWFLGHLGLEGALNALLSVPAVGGNTLSTSGLGRFLVFVYIWLPFMILPVQAALERIPGSLLQASADLGAAPRQTFRYVVLPLAIPGIAAGSIFTFSLTLGDFIVPQLVGPPGYFIGNMVYSQQGAIGNMPMAAAFTLVPIVLIALYLAFVKRLGAFDAL